MSKYTTQLRYICEEKAGYMESTGNYTEVIQKSYDKILHPDTPLFDKAYAAVLYPKIIKHYYFDEIAYETVAHFIFKINAKLDEILPYYNQLYRSTLIEINPLIDTEYTVQGNKEDNNTTDSTRTDNLNTRVENSNKNLYSDTPQGTLDNLEITNNLYVTDATINNGWSNALNSGTQKNNDKIHNINEYFEKVTGKRSGLTYSEMLLKYRETFINIDMMIIEDLKKCFMGVY